MELFALITLNIAFGMGLYIFLSAKMNRAIKENQGSQLEKNLRSSYSHFLQQSIQSMELLDSKIRGLRDIVLRSEKVLEELKMEKDYGSGVSLQLQNLINQSKDLLQKTDLKPVETTLKPKSTLTPTSYETLHTDSISKVSLYKENKINLTKTMEPIRDSAPNLIAKLGQNLRSMMGIENLTLPESTSFASGMGRETRNTPDFSPADNPSQTKKIAYIVEGDVFSDDDSTMGIIDEEEQKRKEEGSFLSTLKEVSTPAKPKDRVTITPESLLADLPPSATKIDKVVHLLKKGYTHEEVSDALDIGTREVSLIETVRLQNSRRV
ncbi:MAG: hypothetical protein JJT78_03500 [Leptospira sp.]|nr:hypothetical protein [Leptospira sp.]